MHFCIEKMACIHLPFLSIVCAGRLLGVLSHGTDVGDKLQRGRYSRVEVDNNFGRLEVVVRLQLALFHVVVHLCRGTALFLQLVSKYVPGLTSQDSCAHMHSICMGICKAFGLVLLRSLSVTEHNGYLEQRLCIVAHYPACLLPVLTLWVDAGVVCRHAVDTHAFRCCSQ